MAEPGDVTVKTYRGNCHCGSFVFEVEAPEVTEVTSCNCSICAKKGYLWIYPKAPVKVIKGEGSLTGYSFGEKKVVHEFCPTCGITPVARAEMSPGVKMAALNVRTFQNVNVWDLQKKKINGQAYNDPYKPPPFTGPEPSADVVGGKVYTGSCHCGAVTAAVKLKALDGPDPERIVDCNCSLCERAAYIWVYPKKEQIVVQGGDNLSYYTRPGGFFRKYFCKTCGVHIGKEPDPLTKKIAELPEELLQERSITLRMLNDFDLDTITPSRFDGQNERQGPYVNP